MSSSSSAVDPHRIYAYRSPQTANRGGDNESRIRPLNYGTKCALAAAVVVGVVGLVLIGLSFASSVGPIGSPGFFTSLVMGAAITTCAAGLIALIICKQTDRQAGSSYVVVQLTTDSDGIEDRSDVEVQQGEPPPGSPYVVVQLTTDGDGIEDRSDVEVQQGEPPPGYLSASRNPQLFVQAALGYANRLVQNAVNLPQVTVKVQPSNSDILRYMQLRERLKKTFYEEWCKYPEDPWSQSEVVRVFNPLMVVSFTISWLALKEINSGDKEISVVYAENKEAFEKYDRMFFLALRGGAYSVNNRIVYYTERESWVNKHAPPFWEQNTPQQCWRILYNAFCSETPDSLRNDLGLKRIDGITDYPYFQWPATRPS